MLLGIGLRLAVLEKLTARLCTINIQPQVPPTDLYALLLLHITYIKETCMHWADLSGLSTNHRLRDFNFR